MFKKKILSGALSFALCLGAFTSHIGTNTVAADTTAGAKIYGTSDLVHPATANLTGTVLNGSSEYTTVTDANGNALHGDIAQVSVYLENTTEAFQVFQMNVDFDSEYFTYLSYNEDEFYSGALKTGMLKVVTNPKAVYEMEDPIVIINSISTNMNISSGIITTLNFHVAHNTPAGCYAIPLEIELFGYKDGNQEVPLNCTIKHNAFITVAGSADDTNAIDLGESADILDTYIADNNVDTTLDGVEGCSPFDIYWSNPGQTTYQIGDMMTLEMGLRGDANLDGTVDTRDAALVASYQSQLSTSTDGDVVLNASNDAMAKTLANVNGDAIAKDSASVGCIDTRDAALVANYSSLSVNYPAGTSDAQIYREVWQSLGITD